jgi:subtilase family serine protease
VPSLAAGASDAASTSLTLPSDIAPGSYFIIASADSDHAISEALETNNWKSSGLVRIGPDMTVSVLTVPALAGPGGSIVVSDTTTNAGGGAAGASVTQFYLSTNGTLEATDTLLGSRGVAALGAATSEPASTTLVLPSLPAGQYYILAKADGTNVVAEFSETNNVRSATIKIGPDLIVSPLSVPQAAAAGGTILVSDTTKNQGGGSAPASQTAFYLSTNNVFDAGDVFLGVRSVPALGASATSAASTSLQIPAGTATGSYYVIATADTAGAVEETVETNNTTAAGVVKVGPDLIVFTLTLPTSATAGATITVTDTTKNAGSGNAGGSTTVFKLSTNTTLDTGDVLLGSRPVIALTGGGSNSGSTTLVIPPETAPGTYYVIAVADGDGSVAETSETNNTRAVSIKILAP